MGISTIRGLGRYIRKNSGFSGRTVNTVIIALGFHPLIGTQDEFRELTNLLVQCANHESSEGYRRLFNYDKVAPLFINHRRDIVAHMEIKAEVEKTDIISLIQDYFYSRRRRKPEPVAIAKALWDKNNFYDLKPLYNLFTYYVLCEIAQTWYNYFENQPA